LVALVSVIWLACSIFISFGFPWMGLGWAGLALSAALWVRMRSPHSIAQVLCEVDAESQPAVAAKAGRGAGRIWAHVAWLSLCPVFVLAGAPDATTNLSACKNGWSACERSRLTLSEMTELARADHARNVAGCGTALSSCDRSRLTAAETIAVAVALYDRNVSNGVGGLDPCDLSRLTRAEAREASAAVHQRRLSDCRLGIAACGSSKFTGPEPEEIARAQRQPAAADCKDSGGCDHPELTPTEALELALASAESQRNYAACRDGRGYCDRSRLTPAQAAAIPSELR
jgi:hypothetical protein